MQSTIHENSKYQVEILANAHCQCGENPLWDEKQKLVYWEDIPNGFVYRLNVQSGDWQKIYDGEVVGGFTLQNDGRLLLFRKRNIALLNEDGTIQEIHCGVEVDAGRFNDVMADSEGRVFAGTGGDADCTMACGLYRLNLDGKIAKLFDGTTCSNGMGFTPDLKQMYWTDSCSKKIFIFDYDRVTGELENRREFYSAPEGVGVPDGMAVDVDGCVWSAHWGGWGVYRFDPSGKLIEKVALPVEQVSSVAFGGANLDELFITTAGGSARKNQPQGEDTADGALFHAHAGVRGLPEFRSAISIAS